MLRFFAPRLRSQSERIVVDLGDWREIAGRLSNVYATPLPQILALPWDKAIKWWPTAQRIWNETWGMR